MAANTFSSLTGSYMCLYVCDLFVKIFKILFVLPMFAIHRKSAVSDHNGKLKLFKFVCSFIQLRKIHIDFGNQ